MNLNLFIICCRLWSVYDCFREWVIQQQLFHFVRSTFFTYITVGKGRTVGGKTHCICQKSHTFNTLQHWLTSERRCCLEVDGWIWLCLFPGNILRICKQLSANHCSFHESKEHRSTGTQDRQKGSHINICFISKTVDVSKFIYIHVWQRHVLRGKH